MTYVLYCHIHMPTQTVRSPRQTLASDVAFHLVWCDHALIPKAVWLNVTFPAIFSTSGRLLWFALSVHECLPTTVSKPPSVWQLDNETGCFAFRTHMHRVCAGDVSITWQEKTPGAWLWAPWQRDTDTEIYQIRWWCEIVPRGLRFFLSADNSDLKVVSPLFKSHIINLWTMGHVRVLLVLKH